MNSSRLLVLWLLPLLLANCASQPAETSAGAAAVAPAAPPGIDEAPRVETPIPDESVRPLLEAEFALRARDFEHGLTLLADQALILTDPALARRALRLAEFVNDADRATAMAIRLADLDPADEIGRAHV